MLGGPSWRSTGSATMRMPTTQARQAREAGLARHAWLAPSTRLSAQGYRLLREAAGMLDFVRDHVAPLLAPDLGSLDCLPAASAPARPRPRLRRAFARCMRR